MGFNFAQVIQILARADAARNIGPQSQSASSVSSMRNITTVDVLTDIATCCGFDPAEARAIARDPAQQKRVAQEAAHPRGWACSLFPTSCSMGALPSKNRGQNGYACLSIPRKKIGRASIRTPDRAA
ncbi:hypothetical protein ABID26_007041 [Mesorhizobium shonense]|uniref:Nif11 domain-containing protein n=1 Tax=Mesorhizobium shonense TaxID=1209948 RepID=A0ABV2I3X3_9HYPH